LNITLDITRPETVAAATAVAGSVVGAFLHKLSLRYHIHLTKGEVAAAAAVVKDAVRTVDPAAAPTVNRVIDTAAKIVDAQLVTPAPVVHDLSQTSNTVGVQAP